MKKKLESPHRGSSGIVSNNFFSYLGFYLISAYCLFCATFYRTFAQLNIQFSFLNFPIFIGEILLFVCLIFLIFQWRGDPPQNKLQYSLIGFYGVLIVWIALWAYYPGDHPLAFRNAAMFYYPMFALIGYEFFKRIVLTERQIIFILFVLLMSKWMVDINNYFVMPYFCLSMAVLLKLKSRLKYLLILPILIRPEYECLHLACNVFSFSFFLAGSARSRMLGHITALIFLAIVCIYYFTNMKKSWRAVLSFLAVAFLLMGVIKLGDKNSLRSMFNFPEIIHRYKEVDDLLNRYAPNYRHIDVAPQLYSKERTSFSEDVLIRFKLAEYPTEEEEEKFMNLVRARREAISQKVTREAIPQEVTREAIPQEVTREAMPQEVKTKKEPLENPLPQNKVSPTVLQRVVSHKKISSKKGSAHSVTLTSQGAQSVPETKQPQPVIESPQEPVKIRKAEEPSLQEQQTSETKGRDLEVAYNNIFFRYLIWKDMVKEMLHDKAWLGVNWGKPQRSTSLEILGWASAIWQQDGWITPHNSYLHLLYRGGILGLILIISLFMVVINLIKRFIALRSLTGIFIMATFVYWMTIMTFLVFLEFPYNAIPLWSLLGMTLAFCERQEKLSKNKTMGNNLP